MRQIVIVGGGFTGTAAAIRLCNSAPVELRITIIEPRDTLGGGLAYSGDDPDHRVNGTHELLVLFPEDIGHFARWYEASGTADRDPQALAETGVRYVRRSDVRRYLNETLQETIVKNSYGTTVHHVRDRAIGAELVKGVLQIELALGGKLASNVTVLAFGGQKPAAPGKISPGAIAHPGYIDDPFDAEALSAIAPENKVLLIGTGLTAADVIATLSRQRHTGPITAISRRGLLPQPQGEAPDVAALMQRLSRPMPRFIERHGQGLSLRAALRALRQDLTGAIAEGRDVKAMFDEARDASAWLWPNFTDAEKRRFLRHLKPWYDVNRYRMVPQTGDTLAALQASEQLTFRIARLVGLQLQSTHLAAQLAGRDGHVTAEPFDTVINCTGPKTLSDDPFVDALCDIGLARRDSLGLGFDVDATCRVLDASGHAQESLWAFGLLTRGRFGDMTAIPQIAFRIERSLAALVRAVASREVLQTGQAE